MNWWINCDILHRKGESWLVPLDKKTKWVLQYSLNKMSVSALLHSSNRRSEQWFNVRFTQGSPELQNLEEIPTTSTKKQKHYLWGHSSSRGEGCNIPTSLHGKSSLRYWSRILVIPYLLKELQQQKPEFTVKGNWETKSQFTSLRHILRLDFSMWSIWHGQWSWLV